MKRVSQVTVRNAAGERYRMNRTWKWDRWYFSFDVDSFHDVSHSSWSVSKADAFRLASERQRLMPAS